MKCILQVLCMNVALLGCSEQPPDIKHSMNDQSNEKGLFVSWQHPSSRRHAILEEADGMVWLYLTGPASMKPERDCPAFTTVTPIDKADWKVIEETGTPPPISKEVASTTAIIKDPRASDFSAKWSYDGESVPWCMVAKSSV